MTRTHRVVAATLALIAGSTLTACAPADPPAAATTPCATADRGRLLSTTAVAQLDSTQVAAALGRAHLTGDAPDGVDRYRVTYCTVSATAAPVVASGLLAVPHRTPAPDRLPSVVYEHSTVVARNHAPSAEAVGDSLLAPLYFATAGFAVAAPDYLGLGTGTGAHPFMRAASEVTATMDLLPAAGRAAEDLGAHLSHQVLLTGHSQGGHAAMAVGAALQNDPGSWQLAALAPMAGPYDLGGTELPAITDPARVDPSRASTYLAYLTLAWNTVYGLYSQPSEVFRQPYADTVGTLFDGTRDFADIAATMPAPQEVFQPEYLATVAHPDGKLAAAARANEVCHWAPAVPTRLYAGSGDRDVVFANTERCRAQIEAGGGTATVANLGPVDHIGTAIAALPIIRSWFTELTRPS